MPEFPRAPRHLAHFLCLAAAVLGLGTPVFAVERLALFTVDRELDHAHDSYDASRDRADLVVELGTEAPEFAWCALDRSLPDSILHDPSYIRIKPGLDGDWSVCVPRRRVMLLHVDWARHLPPGVTITKAALHLVTAGTWYSGTRDSLCATLMTVPGDSLWFRTKGIDDGSAPSDYYALATWNRQVPRQDLPTGSGDPEEWVPPLEDRGQFWNWGSDSDWSANTAASYPAEAEVVIDVTNCVQAAVNGSANNGIMVMGTEYGTYEQFLAAFHWETDPSWADKVPWITVEYREEPHSSPFPGGADWAFVFSTDDGRREANLAYADIFASHGFAYSVFVIQVAMDDAGRLSWSDLVGLRSLGMEIGSHSRWHFDPNPDGRAGLCIYDCPFDAPRMILSDYVRGTDPGALAAPGATGWDSLLCDTDPVWLYDGAEALDGDRRENDPQWGKTFALPLNHWDVWSLQAMAYHGYEAMRCGSAETIRFLPDGNLDFYVPATFRPELADSLRIGFTPHAPGLARNLVGVPLSIQIQTIVGSKDDTGIPREQVVFNLKNLLEKARASHRRVVATFVHDFKTDPDGPRYSEGLDPEELEWILQTVADNGGSVMTVGEYARWMKRTASPVATPAAFAQPGEFRYDAGDSVWFVFQEVDPNDTEPPFIVAVRPAQDESGAMLDVEFSEPVANWSTVFESRFRIDGRPVVHSVRDGEDPKVVHLDFGDATLAEPRWWELSVSEVTDCAGNPVRTDQVDGKAFFLLRDLAFVGYKPDAQVGGPQPFAPGWVRGDRAPLGSQCGLTLELESYPQRGFWAGRSPVWVSVSGREHEVDPDLSRHALLHWRLLNPDCRAEPLDSDRIFALDAGFAGLDTLVARWGTPGDAILAAVPEAGSWRLGPIQPNPFNPRTTVQFSLSVQARVSLVIYDLAGRRVRVMVDQVLAAGEHARVWDGRDDLGRTVPSGVYSCRLECGGSVQSRMMALVR